MQAYLKTIRDAMIIDGNNISFQYMRKICGIFSTVTEGVFSFTSRFGDLTKDYSNIDDALTDDFFGGNSIAELVADKGIRIEYH